MAKGCDTKTMCKNTQVIQRPNHVEAKSRKKLNDRKISELKNELIRHILADIKGGFAFSKCLNGIFSLKPNKAVECK